MKLQGAQTSQILASVNPTPTSLVKNELIQYVTLTDGRQYVCDKGTFGVYRTKSNEANGGPPFVRFDARVESPITGNVSTLTIETFLTSLVAVGYATEPAKDDDWVDPDIDDDNDEPAPLAPPEKFDG